MEKKVLILTTLNTVENYIWGQEKYVIMLSDMLDNRKITNFLVSPVQLKSNNFIQINPNKKKVIYTAYRLYKLIRNKKISVIVSNDIFGNLLTYLASFKLNIKRIAVIHDVYIDNAMPFKLKIKKIIYLFLDKFILNKFDLVLCHSKFMYKRLKKRLKEESLNYVPFIPKITVPNNNKIEFYKNRYSIFKDDFLIGFTGRADVNKKGLDLFVKIIKKIGDVKNCKFVFSGFDELEILEKILLKNGIIIDKKNIIFLGYMNNISDFYKLIDLLIVPSRYESLGFALIESLLYETPVIISDIEPFQEIVKHLDFKYIVTDESVENYCRMILEIKENGYDTSIFKIFREKTEKISTQNILKYFE